MLSKKERIKRGLVGKGYLTSVETGEKIEIDFDDTPIFTPEECEKYKIGTPDMKPFSELTEEERRVFTDFDS